MNYIICKELDIKINIDQIDKNLFLYMKDSSYNNISFLYVDDYNLAEKELKGYCYYEAKMDNKDGVLIFNKSKLNLSKIITKLNQNYFYYANINNNFTKIII